MTDYRWTLEEELCEIAGRHSLGESLKRLDLLGSLDESFKVVQRGEWVRGGGETYLLRFAILRACKPSTELLVKACVAFRPGSTIDQVLDEWISRRETLDEAGVSTPRLYGRGKGVLVEEFIPFSISECLGARPRLLLRALAFFAGALEKCGFLPVAPYVDLRSHGSDVVAVDFGEDLGGGGQCGVVPEQALAGLLDWVKATGIEIGQSELVDMRAEFLRALSKVTE